MEQNADIFAINESKGWNEEHDRIMRENGF